ncbi:hypothetical protein NDU88_003397 [Pleurodeles waltl]|uniref:Uncharacterized protein n=1 Tax=Pleurodeles waltl TaxID=8319 RepID=A0AAV7T611_PLEWA|nr:hypothetical protein NDU88_003397 [Pleurodeles waltl]
MAGFRFRSLLKTCWRIYPLQEFGIQFGAEQNPKSGDVAVAQNDRSAVRRADGSPVFLHSYLWIFETSFAPKLSPGRGCGDSNATGLEETWRLLIEKCDDANEIQSL